MAQVLTQAAEAAAILAAGGIVAFPTETFFGLAADSTTPHALERLARIKGRPESKPFPLIVGDAGQFTRFFSPLAVDQAATELLRARFWPGPLSLVVPARPDLEGAGLAPRLLDADGRGCVRVSGHPVARELALALGRPITATSANRAGEPPVVSLNGLDAGLLAEIDAVLDLPPGPAGGLPSTLVRPEPAEVAPLRIRMLRVGAISAGDLRAAGFTVVG